MISLLKYLKGSWDGAKGYLETDLEHIETALNQLETDVFDADTRTLLAGVIGGNSKIVPRYVANTGPNFAPKWDLVDLNKGVSGILPVVHGGTGQSTTSAAFNADIAAYVAWRVSVRF